MHAQSPGAGMPAGPRSRWRPWALAASLFLVGTLIGGTLTDDGRAQISELEEQLAAARTTAEHDPGPSAATPAPDFERELDETRAQLDDTIRRLREARSKLQKTTRVAKDRKRRLAELRAENATLTAAANYAEQQPALPTSNGVDDRDEPAASGCDPSYPGVCIPPAPPDLNCPDVGVTDFTVVGRDPHGFDRDGDGVGCES